MKNKDTKRFNKAKQWQFTVLIEGETYFLPCYHLPIVDISDTKVSNVFPTKKLDRIYATKPSWWFKKGPDKALIVVNSKTLLLHLAKNEFDIENIYVEVGEKLKKEHYIHRQ